MTHLESGFVSLHVRSGGQERRNSRVRNISGWPPIADVGADIVLRRSGPTADELTRRLGVTKKASTFRERLWVLWLVDRYHQRMSELPQSLREVAFAMQILD